MRECVSVTGLGYVGLPVACAFAKAGLQTVGFDSSAARIKALKEGKDITGSVPTSALNIPRLLLSDDACVLTKATCHIIAVPTPITLSKRPDLSHLKAAASTIAKALKQGALVLVESTVFPGATQEVVAPLLEAGSGLVAHKDFDLAYSPERINPGDPEHSLSNTVKVIGADTQQARNRASALYKHIITAGLHIAPNIATAEAAKAIENTQRDLNIALMNELAMLFHHLGLDSADVLAAAGSKWNFLNFKPGLVGGHCIGVDPYYLTEKAQSVGFEPQVILAGRGTNEQMPLFIATRLMQSAMSFGFSPPLQVTVLGVTYKANVPDIRNSKAVDLIGELQQFGCELQIIDPLASPAEVEAQTGVAPLTLEQAQAKPADLVVIAVPHNAFGLHKTDQEKPAEARWQIPLAMANPHRAMIADLHASLPRKAAPAHVKLWRL
ncbi:nucleotide sugar dehydrogenase [Polycladidibacter hongkongensis]|uniref:nucleotide sugar dehydrogenase n=1 Tax=Polycladidibacter hongkongensis TaxID=1647556 RepID=UPI000835711B|nr:nucleotide sugar dehydrogenase [Pseudovibrio hongkongensis]